MSSAPAWRAVLDQVAPGARLRKAQPLDGGSSAQTVLITYSETGQADQKVVIRIPGTAALAQNPHAAEQEFETLKLLHRLALPAPRPLWLDTTNTILHTPYLVLEWMDGSSDFAPSNPVAYGAQMAAALAAIHTARCSVEDLSRLPQAEARVTRELAARRPILHTTLQEDRIRAALAGVPAASQSARAVLLHGDFWPGNILWNHGQLAAVIDWEDAAAGDPLIDFAIGRLETLWIYGMPAFHAFTAVYQQRTGFALAGLPERDLYAALRLIRMAGDDLAGWAAFFPPRGRRDITADSLRRDLLFFINQALEARS